MTQGAKSFFPAINSKFNSCHDNLGQFCSGGGIGDMSGILEKLNIKTKPNIKVVKDIEGHEGIEAEYKPKDNTILISQHTIDRNPSGNLGFQTRTVSEALGTDALIAHELGHVKDGGWDKNITRDKKLESLFLKQKTDAIDGDFSKVLSKLSLSNQTEFYCEGIAVFSANPDKLKKINPELYAYIVESL